MHVRSTPTVPRFMGVARILNKDVAKGQVAHGPRPTNNALFPSKPLEVGFKRNAYVNDL